MLLLIKAMATESQDGMSGGWACACEINKISIILRQEIADRAWSRLSPS